MSGAKELSVSERVCAAKAEIGAVAKNGYNKHGGYQHATIDDVYEAVRLILAKHNLDLKLDISESQISESAKGTPWVHVKAAIGFDGEEPQRRPMSLPVNGPQTFEAINSYLSKQYIRARFQIPTGEYDEADMTKDNPPADKPPVSANITDEQRMDLEAVIEETGIDKKEFCDWMGVASLNDIRVADHERALAGIRKKREQIAAGQDQQKAA